MLVDPIRLEPIKNALVMVLDNMMVSVLRTARSTVVKANMDFDSYCERPQRLDSSSIRSAASCSENSFVSNPFGAL